MVQASPILGYTEWAPLGYVCMNCPYCTYNVPDALPRCPHCCGRPELPFPNVRQVADSTEIDAIEQRYQRAVADTASSGCGAIAKEFELKVAAAQAVIGRPIEEALRLATADDQAYATFWSLLHAGVRLPASSRWDRLRGLADWELFGAFRDDVRFAALSIDGSWLRSYGAVALELKEPMIAHRATVFEENSAVFFERQRKQGAEPPIVAGYRARWADRGKLALAKHANDLTPTTKAVEFSSILLRAGTNPGDDVFVEVHIYGSLTRNSLSRVIVDTTQCDRTMITILQDRLADTAVQVEER